MTQDAPDPTPDEPSSPRRTVLHASPDGGEYFRLIGRVCADWAGFEARLDLTIRLLSDTDPAIAAAITSQINGPVPRMRAILSLLEVKGFSASTRGALIAFMQKTHGVADERNRIVHDPWIFEWTSQTVQQQIAGRIKKSFVYEHRTLDLKDLDALALKIHIHCVTYEGVLASILEESTKASS